jgi:DNA-binding response OmpR family regulator
LIVEDELAIAQLLADRLRASGYEPAIALDAERALALAAQRMPDLALVDLYMPRVDGVAFVARLRAMGARLPVVMMSAATSGRDAAARSAVRYLEKPFSIDEALAAIEAALAAGAPL